MVRARSRRRARTRRVVRVADAAHERDREISCRSRAHKPSPLRRAVLDRHHRRRRNATGEAERRVVDVGRLRREDDEVRVGKGCCVRGRPHSTAKSLSPETRSPPASSASAWTRAASAPTRRRPREMPGAQAADYAAPDDDDSLEAHASNLIGRFAPWRLSSSRSLGGGIARWPLRHAALRRYPTPNWVPSRRSSRCSSRSGSAPGSARMERSAGPIPSPALLVLGRLADPMLLL